MEAPNNEELAFAGIARQAELLREGAVTSAQLVELYLERIERINPRINAFTDVLADRAREAAAAADRRLAAGEAAPLLGVPVAVKDELEIVGLVKRYGHVLALDEATFTARRGRLVGFLGPNGAGKTTTMRAIFNLIVPDRGEVRWEGRPVDLAARLRFGYMPEQRGLYPRMRVHEQLVYFAQHHGLSGRAAAAAATRWLERLGLADRAGSKLEDLSHGNQQRVQLATALVHDPELLVLDEPFSGLDPIGIATMTEVLRERAAAGVGVIFSSHQLDLVEDVCEDVVIISRGRVVAEGAIEALRAGAGRRHLEIEVRGGDGSWLSDAGQLIVLERTGSRVKLLVDERVELEALLARARAAGEVTRFSYEPPRLSELFMEAVTEPQARQDAAPGAAR